MPLGSASIFDDISNGYWDEGLDAIIEMAVARRNMLRDQRSAKNMVEFRHGDEVRLVNIRPQYLYGITGTINKQSIPRKRGCLVVDIDPAHWRKLGTRYSRHLSVPASSLERV